MATVGKASVTVPSHSNPRPRLQQGTGSEPMFGKPRRLLQGLFVLEAPSIPELLRPDHARETRGDLDKDHFWFKRSGLEAWGAVFLTRSWRMPTHCWCKEHIFVCVCVCVSSSSQVLLSPEHPHVQMRAMVSYRENF